MKNHLSPPANIRRPLFILLAASSVISLRCFAGDPRLDSWLTSYSAQYARIYASAAAQSNGVTVTSWSNGAQTQSLPAYDGVQAVYSSTNWVYVRSTGLGSHVMGPWFLDAAHTTTFPNLPVNTKTFFRVPRSPAVPASKTVNGGGAIGYFVDGVAMFNSWDAFSWNGTADAASTGSATAYWNRDAYVNEGVSFDPALAHQPNSGAYHYHANPIALRYLLGDHVNYDSVAKTWSESAAPVTKHSPILAWVSDGYPLYGPYGYATATNAASGVRRMVSGYVPRNGQYGTDNLSTNGAARASLPAWAQRAYGISASQTGPAVSASYPFGRYMEDNDYLGDHGKTQGVDFDLDEYNGRYCVTPEYPNGTYAYFVCIDAGGAPVFPYNIGRAFYASPTGGAVTTLAETVTTNFVGGPGTPAVLGAPSVNSVNNTVSLEWSSVEGGSYQIVSSTNLTAWTTNAAIAASQGIATGTNLSRPGSNAFFRVALTGLPSYDPVTNSASASGGGILSVSPVSAAAGTTVTLTINLDPNASPASPPQNAPINSVTVGSITGAGSVHVSQTQVTTSITIPAHPTTGAQTVTIVFPGPPANPTETVTYTLVNGFTIN